MSKQAFTLLELIIVMVVLGVLVSLALPRMMRMVTIVKSDEAIRHLKIVKDAMQACLLMNNNDHTNCSINAPFTLPINNPNDDASGKFTYAENNVGSYPPGSYYLTAVPKEGAGGIQMIVENGEVYNGGWGDYSMLGDACDEASIC